MSSKHFPTEKFSYIFVGDWHWNLFDTAFFAELPVYTQILHFNLAAIFCVILFLYNQDFYFPMNFEGSVFAIFASALPTTN